jgi:hypothetical protein
MMRARQRLGPDPSSLAARASQATATQLLARVESAARAGLIKYRPGGQAPELAGDQPWLEREALFLAPRSVRRRAAATCPPGRRAPASFGCLFTARLLSTVRRVRGTCVYELHARATGDGGGELFPEDGPPRTEKWGM